MARGLSTIALLLALACGLFAAQDRPSRDTPAQKNTVRPPAGRITGRVVASDNGRPVKRARVFISAVEMPGGRGMLTDDAGVFDFTELPGGRYTLTVSKSGFVSLSYGQRRPLQAGTPLQLAEDQQIKGIQFQLPRGSVIGGRVLDEDGDAMPGVVVRVMRYQYQQGERRLTAAGTAQTDDRGQFRVWGLMPGDYYINAVMRGGGFGGFGGAFGPGGGAFAGRGGRGSGGAPGGNEQDQTNYAPTYYPGVPSVNEAKPITVGLSQEVLDVNFGMQLVKIARITGHVANPDGTMVTSGNVNLSPESTASGRGNQLGVNFGGRIEWDGAFTITNVPPGRYVLRARADDSLIPLFAMQPLSLNGEDVSDLNVTLSAGASITGAVTFLPGQAPAPDPTQIRLSAPSTDQSDFGPQPNARVDKDGRFALEGVSAGSHLVRAAGNLRGWILKSVTIGGRDVTDTPVAVRSGETLGNVVVSFTDRLSEVNGKVTDDGGAASPDFTVLAFPTDSTLWRPLARQIMTARPDQTGQYRIRGLPPGEYYLVAVDPAEQGEWFEPAYLDDHRAGAGRITLGDGDVKTHDFKVRR